MKHRLLQTATTLVAAAVLAGCSAGKRYPFAELAQTDGQPGEASAPAVVAAPPAVEVVAVPSPLPVAATAPETAASVPSAAPITPSPIAAYEIRVDEDGNLNRSFAPEVFERPSGNVVAGPLYWPNTDRTMKRRDSVNFVMEPLEFLADSLLMPFRAIATPPWRKVEYDPVPVDDTTPASSYSRRPATVAHPVK